MDRLVCEICGKPAKNFVTDLFRNDNWDTGLREYSPNGKPHAYCNDHVIESSIMDITESPLTYFYRKHKE
jgi:hypothetical protein